MAEVAFSGEDHGDAVFVGGGYHFVVSDAASGLDDGFDAGGRRRIQSVAEGEEGVAGAHSAGGPSGGSLGCDAR